MVVAVSRPEQAAEGECSCVIRGAQRSFWNGTGNWRSKGGRQPGRHQAQRDIKERRKPFW
jgi:cation transport regulator ChaC